MIVILVLSAPLISQMPEGAPGHAVNLFEMRPLAKASADE
jgi:hypothetical protein